MTAPYPDLPPEGGRVSVNYCRGFPGPGTPDPTKGLCADQGDTIEDYSASQSWADNGRLLIED
jgi:hypothetical protein